MMVIRDTIVREPIIGECYAGIIKNLIIGFECDGGAPVTIPVFSGVIPDMEFPEDSAIPNTNTAQYFTTGGSVETYSATGLPEGLVISGVGGVISGTPTTVGNYPVTVTGTNSAGSAVSNTFTITITEVVALCCFPSETCYPSDTSYPCEGV